MSQLRHLRHQLETAAGSAIRHFKRTQGISVPRTRFIPVKSCSDLLLVKSDIYSLDHGQLALNENRMFATTPVIKLGDRFKKVRGSRRPTVHRARLVSPIVAETDPGLPTAVQEGSPYRRAGPLDGSGRCVFWKERDAARDGDRSGHCPFASYRLHVDESHSCCGRRPKNRHSRRLRP
jgi:hypothetical protein